MGVKGWWGWRLVVRSHLVGMGWRRGWACRPPSLPFSLCSAGTFSACTFSLDFFFSTLTVLVAVEGAASATTSDLLFNIFSSWWGWG